VALVALDRERSKAILVHVAEGHRLDRIVEAGAGQRGVIAVAAVLAVLELLGPVQDVSP
jgi:hypothetical protein